MKTYRIEITGPAAEDIAEVRRYIALSLMEPGSSAHVYDEIKKAILSLDVMPERNALIQEAPYTEIGVRRMYVGNYTVFYVADEEEELVTVLRVLYSRRDWKHILDGQ